MSRIKLALTLALLCAAPTTALAWQVNWPADSDWLPLTHHGAYVADPSGDQTGSAALDGVGDATNSAVFMWSNANHVFFRLRMNGKPKPSAGWLPDVWACAIDITGDASTDPASYEFFADVNGAKGDVFFTRKPLDATLAYPLELARQMPAATTWSGDPDYFVDFAIQTVDMLAFGIVPGETLRILCSSTAGDHLSYTLPGDIYIGAVSDPVSCGVDGCHMCTTDASCGQACLPCGAGTHCDLDTLTCQKPACTSDDACGVATPICNLATGDCETCKTNAQCPLTAPWCEPDGTCGPCHHDVDCPAADPICDAATGACGPCHSNDECPIGAPICTAAGACVPCNGDGQCDAPLVCDRGHDEQAGQCVACYDNLDCAPPTPYCDGETHTCVAQCTDDGAPSCPDTNHPACNIVGPHLGTCTECSVTNVRMCLGTIHPFCEPLEGRCVSCLTSDDCAQSEVCDPVTRTCVPLPDAGVPDASVADARIADARLADARLAPDAQARPDARITDAAPPDAVVGFLSGGGGCGIAFAPSPASWLVLLVFLGLLLLTRKARQRK